MPNSFYFTFYVILMLKSKVQFFLSTLAFILSAAMPVHATGEMKTTFNSANVVLPSSQYTPSQPYQAQVYIVNTGRNYSDQYYNNVWGTPQKDDKGNEWFAPEYTPVDDATSSWTVQTAPFSSDEYYLGHKSCRWITSDIMGDIYMRRSFTLTEIPNNPLYLACGHDDAPAQWYINGTLVHSVSDGWNNDEYILLSDESKALLKEDENIIAVHVHQNWGGAFADCGLYEADVTLTQTLLPTVADGAWPCRYYILNYNNDIAVAEKAEWFAVGEDESDWISGVGPFSNDNNMFYTTEWPSQVRPLLVRRHFTLTDDDLAMIDDVAEVTLTCSYDENPVVYLNGQRIWSATGWNDNNYADYRLTAEQRSLLKAGDNVLAVSLAQGEGGGHIDYGLEITAPYSYVCSITVNGDKNRDDRIFDLSGRYVGTDVSRLGTGVYIRNGRKFIKK